MRLSCHEALPNRNMLSIKREKFTVHHVATSFSTSCFCLQLFVGCVFTFPLSPCVIPQLLALALI